MRKVLNVLFSLLCTVGVLARGEQTPDDFLAGLSQGGKVFVGICTS
jgi:hypothetical protein